MDNKTITNYAEFLQELLRGIQELLDNAKKSENDDKNVE